VEAKKGICEIGEPTDEEDDHQPVDVNDERIHVSAVFGGDDREAEQFTECFHEMG
jgi:hypothetical protein